MNAVNRRRAIKFLESIEGAKSVNTTALDFFKLNISVRGNVFKRFLAIIDDKSLIDGAFPWYNALIGDAEYWADIHNKWLEHLKSKGRATWGERILSIFY